MESRGVQYRLEGILRHKFVVLVKLIGDLPAKAYLLALAGHRANYPCGICYVPKEQLDNFVSLAFTQRTPDRYDIDVALDEMSRTGVKSKCQ